MDGLLAVSSAIVSSRKENCIVIYFHCVEVWGTRLPRPLLGRRSTIRRFEFCATVTLVPKPIDVSRFPLRRHPIHTMTRYAAQANSITDTALVTTQTDSLSAPNCSPKTATMAPVLRRLLSVPLSRDTIPRPTASTPRSWTRWNHRTTI